MKTNCQHIWVNKNWDFHLTWEKCMKCKLTRNFEKDGHPYPYELDRNLDITNEELLKEIKADYLEMDNNEKEKHPRSR